VLEDTKKDFVRYQSGKRGIGTRWEKGVNTSKGKNERPGRRDSWEGMGLITSSTTKRRGERRDSPMKYQS